MSTKALVTTLIVFAVLVGAALLLNQGGPQHANSSQTTAPLMRVDASRINAIEVRPSDDEPSVVKREPNGGWVYLAGDLEWPVRPDVLNEMLRSLSNLAGTDPGEGATLGERTCEIVLTLDDATTRSITMSREMIGGRTPTRVGDGKVMLIDSALLNAATSPGPRGWRVSDAIPGAGPVETARVTIETPDAGVSLARVEGVWQMRAPIGARASEQAVNGLLQTLSDLKATQFVDGADAPHASVSGLDSPRMVISTERDLRMVDESGKVDVETIGGQLRLGGPASADGTKTYAAPDADASFVMVLDGDPATTIPTSPRHYLATTATGVRPSDVWVVVVTPDSGNSIGRRRELDKWVELRTDGSSAPAEGAPVDELLAFLAETPGEPDIAEGEVAGVRTLAKVDLLDAGGGLLDRVTIGYTPDGQLIARAGRVIWTYADTIAPALLSLPSFADLPPVQERPEAPPENPDAPIKPK